MFLHFTCFIDYFLGSEVLTAVVMKGYNAVYSSVTCFHAGFLLGLFFDPEDGGDTFLRNIV
jgi:hypothetical protein